MSNADLATVFDQIADLMELLGEDRFRVNSYRKAARILDDLPTDAGELDAAGGLTDVPGIGKGTAQRIRQYLQTGQIEVHQELLSRIPDRLAEVLTVPGLGPKTVARLWKQAGITSLADLRDALDHDRARLAKVDGLGNRKIQQMADALAFADASAGRIRLGQARQIAADVIGDLAEVPGVGRIAPAGSVRRGKETIGDIDILAEATGQAPAGVIERHATGPAVTRVVARGDTKCSVQLEHGLQVDLRVVEPEAFGAALAYFTGSKDHNVALRELAVKRGWKLNEYGLFDGPTRLAGADEEGVYRALGLPLIPPPLREDRGEIQAARSGELPRLVQPEDIRGDLHMHTTASDGVNTVGEMIAACRDRGYRYLCISDHSKSQVQAGGLDEDRLRDHAAAIRATAAGFPDMLVLVGIEVDIFKDGSLDFDDRTLEALDFVVGSPHSALSQNRAAATARIVRAIESPFVHCIGHPSGRLIGRREGMDLDIETIAAAAAEHDTALEINASDSRLDLRDTHVRAAIRAGAQIIINTDAHAVAEMDTMACGVLTAQRGWARREDIINTWTPEQLQSWLHR